MGSVTSYDVTRGRKKPNQPAALDNENLASDYDDSSSSEDEDETKRTALNHPPVRPPKAPPRSAKTVSGTSSNSVSSKSNTSNSVAEKSKSSNITSKFHAPKPPNSPKRVNNAKSFQDPVTFKNDENVTSNKSNCNPNETANKHKMEIVSTKRKDVGVKDRYPITANGKPREPKEKKSSVEINESPRSKSLMNVSGLEGSSSGGR